MQRARQAFQIVAALDQIIVGVGLERRDRGLLVAGAGDDYHRQRQSQLAYPRQCFETGTVG
jgi:hypothetical protein